MQNIERGGYSREEILDVLHSKNGTRKVRFRYDLLDKDGYYKKTLDTVLSGEVSMSALSTIKRTAKFKIKERYIPEHWGRGNESDSWIADNVTEWQRGTSSGVVYSNGAMRLTTPVLSAIPDSNFNENTTWAGVHPNWAEWGTGKGTWSRTGVDSFDGQAQRITRTATGSLGIQTASRTLITPAVGDTIYLSFLFKPSNANFSNPSYCYVMWSDGLDNTPFTNYTIEDIGNGWYRYYGSVSAPKGVSCGVLIGWTAGSDGNVVVDNVYFARNTAPVYHGEWISPVIDISRSTGTYVSSSVDYLITINNPKDTIQIYSRVSFDDGVTWSGWVPQGKAPISSLTQGDNLERARLQFKVVFDRYDITATYSYLMSISMSIVKEVDVLFPETTEINYLSDRIQPFMEVQMPDGNWIEFPLGVFLLSTPTRHDDVNGVYRNIEAYDGLIILDDDKFTSRYNIPAGTKYTKAVEDILISAGITRFNIADKADTLTTDKEFKIGTSKLEAINELLGAINYTPIWVDANGYFIAYQYVSPADRREDFTYADDELSVIYDGMEEELDLTNVANYWVVTQSNPEKEPLVATKVNNNPDSPTSTVNLGRTIVDFREVDDISDQATLNAYVDRIAFEASQVFGKLKFKTALMPFHEYADVLHIKYDTLKIDYKFSETNWTMKLEAGGEMEHEVRRVVSI